MSQSNRNQHEAAENNRPLLVDDDSETDSSQNAQPNTSPQQPLELEADFSSIVEFCCTLVIWLNLKAGVSRSTANIVLKALQFILTATLQLIQIALRAQLHQEIKLPGIQVPQDVRTAFSLQFNEPKLERTPCCPYCHKLYPEYPVPFHCGHRDTPKSRPCNTQLWRKQRIGKTMKLVPHTLYNTQDFRSWLHFFLSLREVDEHLGSTFGRTPAVGAAMYELQDSPAWAELKEFRTSKYHLLFSIYIDWFNPLTNKIAGKNVSCGAIILNCLNLPRNICFLPAYSYVAGLTPSPFKPEVTHLPHVLDPVIEAILLSENAEPIPTYHNPLGVDVPARIIPLLADVVGSKEVGGFLSHSANCFCTYCNLTKDQIESLDISSWSKRTKEQVLAQATEWKNAVTKKERKQLATKYGVRSSSFHGLWYWDPVLYTILGYMHNWLEGILAHQLRILWGIGRPTKKQDKRRRPTEQDLEQDLDESPEEADNLNTQNAQYECDQLTPRPTHAAPATPQATPAPEVVPRILRRTNRKTTAVSSYSEDDLMDVDDEEYDSQPSQVVSSASTRRSKQSQAESESEAEPELVPESEAESEDEEDDPNDCDPTLGSGFDFTKAQLETIRQGIQDVSLPTWVSRPPTNLGEKKHGKLKADQYLILFSAILPLILPAILVDQKEMLESFHNLLAATHIIVSYKTSNSEADRFTVHYIAYRRSIQTLFPRVPSKPNHHYAMHYADILKYWGPVPGLSEFPGESMNGMFQKVKTNKHTYDMDLTMLKQVTRLCQSDALLRNKASDNPKMKALADILDPKNTTKGPMVVPMDAAKESVYLAKEASELSETNYRMILGYINNKGPDQYRDATQHPHPDRALILPPLAKQPQEFHENGRTYSCRSSHEGNSLIQFYDKEMKGYQTGVIKQIFEIPLQGYLRKFILVSPHDELEANKPAACDPKSYPHFMSKIVAVKPSKKMVVIEPEHIITHLTAFKTKGVTYGIDTDNILIVCWALNRGRKEFLPT